MPALPGRHGLVGRGWLFPWASWFAQMFGCTPHATHTSSRRVYPVPSREKLRATFSARDTASSAPLCDRLVFAGRVERQACWMRAEPWQKVRAARGLANCFPDVPVSLSARKQHFTCGAGKRGRAALSTLGYPPNNSWASFCASSTNDSPSVESLPVHNAPNVSGGKSGSLSSFTPAGSFI